MQFNEKINLLMKMANTTNTKLADALGIDPSLVSRWRTGAREPNDDSRYIQLIGIYFASQAKQDFQRVAILELTGHQMEDKNVGEPIIANYLTRWLSDESKISPKSIQVLLDSIGSAGNTVQAVHEVPLPSEPSGQAVHTQSFSGLQGLRAATVKLLMHALNSPKKQTKLYLYSDESMDWIIEDPEFAKQWIFLMSMNIRRGMHIEIIHTLSRDSNELATAVHRWLPFYMTGSIVSYYYPEKRDDMFNHTSFVLEGEATVFSTSVRGQNRDTIQYIYATDPSVISGGEETFKRQLQLCKPLVRTATGRNTRSYVDEQISLFSSASGSGVGMQGMLLSGMPPELLDRMLRRQEIPGEERKTILEQQMKRLKLMHQHLERKEFQMVISLPRITDVLKGKVTAIVPELITQQPFTYLPMEYHEHLMAVIDLLERHDRLEICILPNKHMLHNVQIFAMQNSGMLVLKHRDPKFVFISEQKDLISAMIGFMRQVSSRIPKRERNKAYVLEKLREFAKRVEEGSAMRMLP
ncbi:MAG: helix-turn-helix domain-containing protein [Sphaerochaetaceae bacterium]